MVATRLLEVTNKGTEWAYSGSIDTAASPTRPQPVVPPLPSVTPIASTTSTTSSSSYLDYANQSIQYAADSTYDTLTSLVSSLYKAAPSTDSMFSFPTHSSWSSLPAAELDDAHVIESTTSRSAVSTGGKSRRASGMRRYTSIDLRAMLQNPYNSVRGRHENPSSISAVRSLITLVPMMDGDVDDYSEYEQFQVGGLVDPRLQTVHEDPVSGLLSNHHQDESSSPLENSWIEYRDRRGRSGAAPSPSVARNQRNTTVSSAEKASQLAEGTLRALRDMALDEAVELHESLHFWSARWERPVWSWWEAGPLVWFSEEGYNHQVVGQKVSQIQAVLARRCASIGELQQHLLRAGWQRGVAQWGVLGQGGQWAAVAGFDGSSQDETNLAGSLAPTPVPAHRRMSSAIGDLPPPLERQRSDISEKIFDLHTSSRIGIESPNPKLDATAANIFVRNRDGGGIFVDDPGFLTQWSIEAMDLVRTQMHRAGNGLITLPFESNWVREDSLHGEGQLILDDPDERPQSKIPFWAMDRSDTMSSTPSHGKDERLQPSISDLPLMVTEVSELLDVMEDIMLIQRQRRLEKLRPPVWLRRHWHLVAAIVPSVTYLTFQLTRKSFVKDVLSSISKKVTAFFQERLVNPVFAIFNEIWKGRESFSDRNARVDAIHALKQMIRSWLDDTFPNMPVAERIAMAERMDISLIEQKKEESMRTFYEINNVVRMSFIEMQYMKKEMMSALDAMDEICSANDINMNLAAVTPTVIVSYVAQRVFRFLLYALLELGKSQEETHASFRNILTDIERLLVMRDNPPKSPPLSKASFQPEVEAPLYNKPCVLGADDLGMLMLLLHELRTIMWRDRRRFPVQTIRSVSEDVAELAGERGAVSVQQQLMIITRMTRSYPFLKVISTGHLFSYSGRLR